MSSAYPEHALSKSRMCKILVVLQISCTQELETDGYNLRNSDYVYHAVTICKRTLKPDRELHVSLRTSVRTDWLKLLLQTSVPVTLWLPALDMPKSSIDNQIHSVRKGENTCFTCGRAGHYASNCPLKDWKCPDCGRKTCKGNCPPPPKR